MMHECLSSITLLTTSLYLSGIDKPGVLPPKIKLCFKITSLSVAIILFVIIMINNIDKAFEIILWNFLYSFHYLIVVVYNVFFEEKTIRSLFKNLKQVDENLNVGNSNTTLSFYISLLTTIVVSIKLFSMFALIYGRDEQSSSLPVLLASQVCIYATELEQNWRIHLVMIIWYRLKYIWKALKALYPLEWFVEPEINVLLPDIKLKERKDVELLKLVKAYQALADAADDVSRNFQLNFATRLISSLLNLFILIYRFMGSNADVGNLASVVSSFGIGMASAFILTLFPCVIAEECEAKSKDIKRILVHQTLRRGIGVKEKTILHQFIKLINIRPICFYLFGIYKVDASLIVDSFNVSLTYTIFLLQSI